MGKKIAGTNRCALRPPGLPVVSVALAFLLVILVTLSAPLAVQATEVFSDGFNGNMNNWVQGATAFTYATTPSHGSYTGTGSAAGGAAASNTMWHTFARPFAQCYVSGYFYDTIQYRPGYCGATYRQALCLRDTNNAAAMFCDNGYYSSTAAASYFWRTVGTGGVSYTAYATRYNPGTCPTPAWIFFETTVTTNAPGSSPVGTVNFKVTDGGNAGTNTTQSLTTTFFQYGVGRIHLGLGTSSANACNWDDIHFTANTPGAPTIGAATANSTSQITWAWTRADNNMFGFDVADSGGTVVSPAFGVAGWPNNAATSYAETGLAANTSYTRKVLAWNGTLNSGWSGTATKYTLQNAATTPTFSSLTTSGFRVSTTGPVNLSGNSGVIFHNGTADRTKVTQLYEDITGLSANTSYTYKAKGVNGDSAVTGYSGTASVYTLQNAATTPSFGTVTKNSIVLNTTGPANLSAGSSGVIFKKNGTTDLAKVSALTTTDSGLAANTSYSYTARGVNGDGTATSQSSSASDYTLSEPPVSGSVTPNTATPCAGTDNVVWTNTLGFGAAGVQYFRYVFDQTSTHTWADTESQWSSGTLTTSANASGDWYLHVKGYNADGVGNGTHDYSITANANPVAPDSASNNGPVCAGSNATLSYVGGSGTTLKWYSDSSCTAYVGSGQDLSVGPLSTSATYYARWESDTCGNSDTVNTTVTVNANPVAPDSASNDGPVCAGSNATLSYVGGSGTTLKWYSNSACTTDVGSGQNLSVGPLSTSATYYARWETAICGSSGTVNTTVTVNQSPTTASVGSGQSILVGGTTTALGGNTPAVGTGAWSIVSGGTGTFGASTSGSSTFTHTGGDGPIVLRWTISHAPCTASTADLTVTIITDSTPPVLSNVSVTDESTGPAPDNHFLKGTVTVQANATDADSGVNKVEFKVDSGTYTAMTLNSETGKYVGEVEINATWTNTSHSITVKATDNAANSSEEAKTFTVNKNEIGGLIALDGFTTATVNRSVTFVINGSITKTVGVTFILGTGSYLFTDVPDVISSISAKTAWNLRRKISSITTASDGQYDKDFTGDLDGGWTLRGGDLNADNKVNALDYSILRAAWGSSLVGDVNGDGATDNTDYLIMKASWYKSGDLP
jgi:hypothetical protein